MLGQCEAGFSVDAGGPYEGLVGEPIQFAAVVTTNPGEQVVAQEWLFGDGEGTTSALDPTHSYSEADVFLVGLTVRTNLGSSLSTSTTATVLGAQTVTPVLQVQFAADLGTILVHAFALGIGPTERVFVRVRIQAPFFAGSPSGPWRDFHDSSLVPQPYLFSVQGPIAGRWRVIADFEVRDTSTGTSRLLAPLIAFADVPAIGCPPAAVCVDVIPKEATVHDGTTTMFQGALTGGLTAQGFTWTANPPSQAPPFGNLPGQPRPVFFAPGPVFPPHQVFATAKWYAFPVTDCGSRAMLDAQSTLNSTYVIKATGFGPFGNAGFAFANLRVIVPWAPAGEQRDPNVIRSPAMACDPECRVTGPGLLERRVPDPIIHVPPNSIFRDKTVAHENEHFLFWTTGSLGLQHFRVSDLVARLVPLRAVSFEALQQLVSDATLFWHVDEHFRYTDIPVGTGGRTAFQLDQKAAYDTSDRIHPRFLYQNCERFK